MTGLPKATIPPRRSLFRELFADNPMLDEAIRARRRFRRGGATAGPALYYAIIGLIVLAYAWSILVIVHGADNVTQEISFFELIIVTLAMPLSVYSTIAGERERATWEALVLTRLTCGQILAGKLTWRITSLVTLMIILSLQIYIGENVHPEYGLVGVFAGQILVLTWGIFLGALTLFISTISKRSVAALGITATTLLSALLLFPLLVSLFSSGFYGGNQGDRDTNNLFSTHALMQFMMRQNPFTALSSILDHRPWGYGHDYLSVNSQFFVVNGIIPIAAVVYAGLALVFLFLGYRMLRKLEAPQETERDYRKRFRDEIGPHIGIGAVTAVAFCLLTWKMAEGDFGLIVVATLLGLVLGSVCGWLVSRAGKALPRK